MRARITSLAPVSLALTIWAFVLDPALSVTARSTEIQPPDDRVVAERLDEYIRALATIDRFNGVVLWADGPEVLLLEAYPMEQLPRSAAVDANLPFHIASIRKLFSEWLLHDAARRGLLQMEDTVSRFFPDFPRGGEITLRHLLEHQSGLPRGERYQFQPRYYPLEDYLPLIQSHPLKFDPGSDTRYSNFGYMLIDLVLREATGTHPAELLESRLFERVGMPGSFEYHRRPDNAAIAAGMFEQDGKLQAVGELDIAQFETGNVFSTATDLLAFVRHSAIQEALPDKGSIAHAGGKKGFRSWLYHDAARDRTLVVLSNLATTPIQRVIEETGTLLEGGMVELPKRVQRQPIDLDRDVLARYVGRYRVIANGQVLDVRLEDGGLVVYEATEQGLVDPQPLHPESETAFFTAPDSSDTVRFVTGPDGTGPAMVLSIMGGFELETERLR